MEFSHTTSRLKTGTDTLKNNMAKANKVEYIHILWSINLTQCTYSTEMCTYNPKKKLIQKCYYSLQPQTGNDPDTHQHSSLGKEIVGYSHKGILYCSSSQSGSVCTLHPWRHSNIWKHFKLS